MSFSWRDFLKSVGEENVFDELPEKDLLLEVRNEAFENLSFSGLPMLFFMESGLVLHPNLLQY